MEPTQDGEIYPEWLTLPQVVGKDGKVTNYVGTFVDFTERKQLKMKSSISPFMTRSANCPTGACCLTACARPSQPVPATRPPARCYSSTWMISRPLNDTKGTTSGT